jgi:hypothetical protein
MQFLLDHAALMWMAIFLGMGATKSMGIMGYFMGDGLPNNAYGDGWVFEQGVDANM